MPIKKIEWLSIGETAIYLGFSENTISRWLAAGKLRHYKIGRNVRIAKADIDVYVASRLIESK